MVLCRTLVADWRRRRNEPPSLIFRSGSAAETFYVEIVEKIENVATGNQPGFPRFGLIGLSQQLKFPVLAVGLSPLFSSRFLLIDFRTLA